ncbi:hypothetical protein R3I94_005023 [Phoxinus phoxinus]|uniref:Uncharacterized protein n=1 Tax=Phoxinus phoxinus TaxID=58324 RepID=A0AAN9HC08_9TELE
MPCQAADVDECGSFAVIIPEPSKEMPCQAADVDECGSFAVIIPETSQVSRESHCIFAGIFELMVKEKRHLCHLIQIISASEQAFKLHFPSVPPYPLHVYFCLRHHWDLK